MKIDLFTDANFRGYTMEQIARRYLRREREHAFIFRTVEFMSLQGLLDYYSLVIPDRLDVEPLARFFKSIDLLEFIHDNRMVHTINLFEVKSKVFSNRDSLEISQQAYDRYKALQRLGFKSHLVYIELLPYWRFSIDVYNLFSFRALRVRENKLPSHHAGKKTPREGFEPPCPFGQ